MSGLRAQRQREDGHAGGEGRHQEGGYSGGCMGDEAPPSVLSIAECVDRVIHG